MPELLRLRLRRSLLLALAVPLLFAACNTLPTVPPGTEVPAVEIVGDRNLTEWDLPAAATQPALGGFDPVAYFPEGGGAAREGNPTIAVDAAGVRYLFASEENRARFLENPLRYEPAHGGWCSWAMRDGTKTEVDPRSFIVREGRLFLFYDGVWGDTRALWEKTDHAESVRAADARWRDLSSEEPRGRGSQ